MASRLFTVVTVSANPGGNAGDRDGIGVKSAQRAVTGAHFAARGCEGDEMCGIVGYVGAEAAIPVLMDGLARLEYRGYDSAGVAVVSNGKICASKRAGTVAELRPEWVEGTTGIGHTRWATHGPPTTVNAHPHLDCDSRIAIIHNGIIENHRSLRTRLEREGHNLVSDTDSELLAHLIESNLDGESLLSAVRSTMGEVEGSVAMVAVDAADPGRLVAARRDSPLLIGLGDGCALVASDIPALLSRATQVAVVGNDQVALVEPGGVEVTDVTGAPVSTDFREIDSDVDSPEKGGYDTFMLKEIYEQPEAIRNTIRGRSEGGRLLLDEMRLPASDLTDVDKVMVVACGTSFHAGMVAKYAIEHWCRLPVEIDIASEFRYRDPVMNGRTLVVGVSQSGETADTLAACRFARGLGARVVAVCNVVDSSMAREADAVLYTRAGPEVGVAATKTFTAQMAAMELLGLYLAEVRNAIDPEEERRIVGRIGEIPGLIESWLDRWRDQARATADSLAKVRDFFFLGRGVGYPVALEGALKLKEISYLRAEGYPAGEMKHGPIALIEPGVVVVVVATKSHVQAKVLSNLQEMKARGATIVVVANEDDDAAIRDSDLAFTVPETEEMLSPLLDVLPLQLFAYEIARRRGLDVDKPRNLAKTVTVE